MRWELRRDLRRALRAVREATTPEEKQQAEAALALAKAALVGHQEQVMKVEKKAMTNILKALDVPLTSLGQGRKK